jgi:glycosyltransferase involved in cell wall biosynthesis
MPDIPDNLLPNVTLITPTKNREWMFSLTKFNFKRFNYPPSKLEWIIIDSSDTDDLKYQFNKSDPKIKYLHVPDCTIAHKRNLACRLASYPIIVHIDDDDYYPPETIIARVKPIISYKEVECVGCSRIGVYDILNDRSFISSDGLISLSEASMAYTKKFWEAQGFDPDCQRGEYKSFIQNRLNMVMDLPYIFVIIATNHGRNITQRMEWTIVNDQSKQEIRNSKTNQVMNFPDILDYEAQVFMSDLRKYLLGSKWYMDKINKEKEQITLQIEETTVEDNQQLCEDNQQLCEDNQQLCEDNQQLCEDNQQLCEDESDKLENVMD